MYGRRHAHSIAQHIGATGAGRATEGVGGPGGGGGSEKQ
jgi:hypothetical protein